ncbi:hypothetical protein RRG08_029820 [Elysia crispata]|uniref:Uncharacterized protein n=1 Tax=Elysia crispata TaxID=231223 RepID=A0AAE0YMG3_9GAST|nr:hypothetical protein RRG08_029820 [Elysia crispata]
MQNFNDLFEHQNPRKLLDDLIVSFGYRSRIDHDRRERGRGRGSEVLRCCRSMTDSRLALAAPGRFYPGCDTDASRGAGTVVRMLQEAQTQWYGCFKRRRHSDTDASKGAGTVVRMLQEAQAQ